MVNHLFPNQVLGLPFRQLNSHLCKLTLHRLRTGGRERVVHGWERPRTAGEKLIFSTRAATLEKFSLFKARNQRGRLGFFKRQPLIQCQAREQLHDPDQQFPSPSARHSFASLKCNFSVADFSLPIQLPLPHPSG